MEKSQHQALHDVHSSQTENRRSRCNEIRGQECPRHTSDVFPDPNLSISAKAAALQKFDRALFVTFCKLTRVSFPENVRDSILQHCFFEHQKRIQLHAAAVMPDHVHLLFTPLRDESGWPYPLPKILKMIKGTSARDVNKLLGTCGPAWEEESFDHVLRSNESLLQKIEYIKMNPVPHSKKEKAAKIPLSSLYLCRQRPEFILSEVEGLPHTFACSTIGPAGLNLRRLRGV